MEVSYSLQISNNLIEARQSAGGREGAVDTFLDDNLLS
jgi:hypothetical protein